MPNHVHLNATPPTAEALAHAVGATHLRYTRQINSRERPPLDIARSRMISFSKGGAVVCPP
jgi:putative transposase